MDIKIENLSVSYGKKTVLENINLTIPGKQITAIIGRNGSGKSSLVSCFGGFMDYEGKIFINGSNISLLSERERAQHVSVMMQFLPSPHITVSHLVSFGRTPYHSLLDKLNEDDLRIINESLESAGIYDLKDRYVDTLSGGERRLAFYAMSLARTCPVMIFDEATAYMDADNEGMLLDKLAGLKSDGKTVITVMHNISDAVKYADNIILLDKKRCVFFDTVKKILETDILEKTMNVKRYYADGRTFFSY